jgi:ATP-dependent protease ClpP protease subunit
MVMVNPKITPKQVEKLIQFDKIYTAQQALDAGLIDQIIYPKG